MQYRFTPHIWNDCKTSQPDFNKEVKLRIDGNEKIGIFTSGFDWKVNGVTVHPEQYAELKPTD